ncbi:MAG: PQQ-like beta-propeller repeat protein [Tannerellaceae bacterium]|jgi:outer membrane protein assembly factor BamB|nr:PQQ-like beta-propeller repeat protein [Tannerellaceae bacterium]
MKKVSVLCLSLLSLSLHAQDNIRWRGTDRSGIYHEAGLLMNWPAKGPALLWSYDGLGEGFSSVAIDSDKLYITGCTDAKGYIYVFDTAGKLLNKKEYGPEWVESYNGTRATVNIDGGKIYIVTGTAEIYCLDQQSLNVVWKKSYVKDLNGSNIQWGVCESPLIIGDKVIATPGGKGNNIVALNKNTGELVWSSPADGDSSAYCSPLYISDLEVPLIVTMMSYHIVGIHAETGQKLWSYENRNRHDVHANTPVYSDGMLLCTSGYGRGSTMLKLTNGGRGVEKVWFSEELDNRIGAMVKVGNHAYGSGDNNRYWYCVDWESGEIKWKERGLAMGNIIANDGMLYCYTDRGEMILARATPEKLDITGKFSVTLGTAQHWAHPVLYKGAMYVRHGNTLMAYKVK